jgi:hypothetical protein
MKTCETFKICAGIVRQKKGGKCQLLLNKRWHLRPPFLSNEPGTGLLSNYSLGKKNFFYLFVSVLQIQPFYFNLKHCDKKARKTTKKGKQKRNVIFRQVKLKK